MRHQQLLDSYLNYVGLNRTPSTVDCHRTKIRPLLKYWDHLGPQDFTRAEFEKYVGYGRNEKKWKPRTQQILIDCVREFIRWSNDHDLGIPDFCNGIKKPKSHKSSEVVYYTEDEVHRARRRSA